MCRRSTRTSTSRSTSSKPRRARTETSSHDQVGYGEALRSPGFRALFASQSISLAGESIASVALTVLVYRRTGSPFLSSLTFALGFVPFAFGGTLLSGLVDRVDPRRLVNRCDILAAATSALMAWPGMPVPALLALLFALGTIVSVASGGRGALVRATVSVQGYVPARSVLKIASQSAQIGGTALGGVILVALGTSGAILLNAASFVVSFALIRFLVADHPTLGNRRDEGLLSDSLAGVRELLHSGELASLLLLGWLVATFSVAPEALAAPYVAAHHGSPELVGWWLAALPVGMIVGDLAAVRFLRASTHRRLMLPVAGLNFVPYLVFVLRPSVPVAIGLLVVSGLASMYTLGLDGRIRDAASERIFGRMMALNTAGLMSLQGLGFALAGGVAEVLGSPHTIALAGACGLAAVGVLSVRLRAGTSVEVPNLSM